MLACRKIPGDPEGDRDARRSRVGGDLCSEGCLRMLTCRQGQGGLDFNRIVPAVRHGGQHGEGSAGEDRFGRQGRVDPDLENHLFSRRCRYAGGERGALTPH